MSVSAVEDSDAADDSVTLVHTAAGGEYQGVSESLVVTVVDDESVGVVLSKSSLSVEEGDTGGESYGVRLSHEPSGEVTVKVSGHAGSDVRLSGLGAGNTLTFTAEDWDTAQLVTVSAVGDGDAADDSVTLVHEATGGEYEGVSADMEVTVADDDEVGLVVVPSEMTVVAGSANSYLVSLGSAPGGAVTVTVHVPEVSGLTVSGLGVGNTLTFGAEDWDTPRMVTVAAAVDAPAGSVTIGHSASGGGYDGEGAEAVVTVLPAGDTITVQLGVTASRQSLTVVEGGSGTYSVVLSHRPNEDVELRVFDPSDNTDVTASPEILTFTPPRTGICLSW